MEKTLAIASLLSAASIAHSNGAAVWLGTSTGLVDGPNTSLGGDGDSLYQEANWDDDTIAGIQAAAANTINNSANSPAGLGQAIIVSNGGVAGGAVGAGTSTAHLRTNGNAITVTGTGSGIKLVVGSRIENDATSGGTQTTVTVGSGGFITASGLQDTALSISGSASALYMHGVNTAGLSNSTIDLVGINANSPSLYWTNITSANLFVAGVLNSITVGGAAAVWGADPLVFEAGDTLVATAQSFTSVGNAALSQNVSGSTNGFLITAVPEPSSTVLLGLGTLGLISRRRKA